MDDIKVYLLKTGCPKCETLQKICKESKYIKNSNVEYIRVDPDEPNDSNLKFLLEHNISSMPVMFVKSTQDSSETFYNFSAAVFHIRNKDREEL